MALDKRYPTFTDETAGVRWPAAHLGKKILRTNKIDGFPSKKWAPAEVGLLNSPQCARCSSIYTLQ